METANDYEGGEPALVQAEHSSSTACRSVRADAIRGEEGRELAARLSKRSSATVACWSIAKWQDIIGHKTRFKVVIMTKGKDDGGERRNASAGNRRTGDRLRNKGKGRAQVKLFWLPCRCRARESRRSKLATDLFNNSCGTHLVRAFRSSVAVDHPQRPKNGLWEF